MENSPTLRTDRKRRTDYILITQRIAKSTANALRELAGAKQTLPTVYSAQTYQCVARAHKKTDKQDRPKDQVRDFLASQISRIKNELKVTSSDARVGLLNAQTSCLRTAEREYIKLQDTAVGRELEKKKDKGIEDIRSWSSQSSSDSIKTQRQENPRSITISGAPYSPFM